MLAESAVEADAAVAACAPPRLVEAAKAAVDGALALSAVDAACAPAHRAQLTCKRLVHVRLVQLPPVAPFTKLGVSSIRSTAI